MEQKTNNKAWKNRNSQGVALLFVVLLTSVLFLIAMGIANVTSKEVAFSIEARDSDLSFFASDTGIECGFYLYKKEPAAFTSGAAIPSATYPYTCNNQPLMITLFSGVAIFAVPVGNQCAQVSIDQTVPATNPDGSPMMIGTPAHAGHYFTITSKGFNKPYWATPIGSSSTCLSGAGVTPANLVSRVLQTTYIQ